MKTTHDLEMRLYQWPKKATLCLVFDLVTQKYNVISNDGCCLPSHIIFICVFTIVYFPFCHKPRTLFLQTYKPNLWGLVRVLLKFCVMLSFDWHHPLGMFHFPLIATSHSLERIIREYIGWVFPFYLSTCPMIRSSHTHPSHCAWFRDLWEQSCHFRFMSYKLMNIGLWNTASLCFSYIVFSLSLTL